MSRRTASSESAGRASGNRRRARGDRAPVASTELPGEAERFVPDRDGPDLAYEHLHRYVLAAEAVRGLKVLDLAAGSGYGARLLESSASRVVSVDLERLGLSVEHGGVQADAMRLPFRDASFDAVVCFEAIEHVSDPERLIAEVRRVLREPAIFIVSTPDREIYTDRAGHENPFHIAEMTRAEFESRLRAQFRHVQVFGQGLWAGSWMTALPRGGGARALGERTVAAVGPGEEAHAFARRRSDGAARWAPTDGVELPTPVYLVALCADAKSGDGQLRRRWPRESMLHDPSQWLLGQYDRLVQARGGEVEAFRAELARAQAGHADLEGQVERSREAIRQREAEAQAARASIDALERQIAAAREAAAAQEADREVARRNAEDMQGQLDSARVAAGALESECDALRSGLAQAEARAQREAQAAAESEERRAEVARDLLALRETFETEIGEARDSIGTLEREVAAARASHDELEHQIEASARIVADKDRELAVAARNLDSIRADLDHERESTAATISVLEAEIAAARTSSASLSAEIDAARIAASAFETERVQARSTIDDLAAEVGRARVGAQNQEDALLSARGAIEAKDAEIDRARFVIAAKDEELERSGEVVAAKDAELDRARDVIAGKDAELDRARDVIAGKDDEIDAARRAGNVREAELVRSKERLDAQGDELGAMRSAARELEARLRELEECRASLEAELAASRSEAERRAEALAREEGGRRAEREEATTLRRELEARLGDLEATSNELAADRDALERAGARPLARFGGWLADRIDRLGGTRE